MPKGYKTPGTLVAEIKMGRMSHDGAFLLVEGNDDVLFWTPTTRHHADCKLVDGEGKQNVIGGIQKLDYASFAGVLGIVDSDYDPLNGMDIGSDNLLLTDAHDLECLLCRSSALDMVLAEYGNRPKIERFEDETGTDVRTGLLERALIFGRLRWAAVRSHPVIDLRGFKVRKFVDEDTWIATSEESLCAALPDSLDDSLELKHRVDELPAADPWYVVHGRDMVEILRIGLRRTLGDMPVSIGVKDIARMLRAAMTPDDLQATQLWTDMRAWEAANHPYMVLATRSPA